MKSDYYPIEGSWKGRLAIAARPRGDDWLEDELRAWKEQGFDWIVSLLTKEEELELGIQNENTLARKLGIEFHSLPIPDRGVPPSRPAINALVRKIRDGLRAERNILVHCRQGIGRSSLIAALVLLAGGAPPNSVWPAIEAARGRPVPDTPEQRDWALKSS